MAATNTITAWTLATGGIANCYLVKASNPTGAVSMLNTGYGGNAPNRVGFYDSATDGGNNMSFVQTNVQTVITASVTEATNIKNKLTVGNYFGQCGQTQYDALTTAINNANAANVTGKTQKKYAAAVAALYTAINNCKASVSDVDKLQASDAKYYRWYYIKNSMANNTTPWTNVNISSGARTSGQFFGEAPATDADKQLFRFEVTGSQITAIVNKAGYYMTTGGALSTTKPTAAFTFDVVVDLTAFRINPTTASDIHEGSDGGNLSNWDLDADNNQTIGGSAWTFSYAKETQWKLGTPTISPNGATNITAAAQTITLTSAESLTGEQIYYTTDGTAPTTSSNLYTAPFDITYNTTVKAIAVATGYTNSDATSADFTFMALNWIGNSYVTIGGASGTWYDCSGVNHTAFNGANLGDFAASITLGGEVQVYPKTAEGVQMGYKIDGGADVYVTLPKTGEVGNNSKHYEETTVDISALSTGSHTIAVWYKAVRDGVTLWDSNNTNNYVANFTKTATGLSRNEAQNYVIRVNEGVITVDGVKNFEVYSSTGRKQNTAKTLKSGIYIVKINNFAQKIVVK